jgi:hypothetical protein
MGVVETKKKKKRKRTNSLPLISGAQLLQGAAVGRGLQPI